MNLITIQAPTPMTKSTVFQKHFMPLHLSLTIHLYSLLLSLTCIQSLSFLSDTIQRHPTDLLSEDQDHTLVNHEISPPAQSTPAYASRMDLGHCRTFAVNNWGFANPRLPNNIAHLSSNASTAIASKLETPHLATRQSDPDPDLTMVCNQIAGFAYARSGTFACTQPLHLLPNRTYIFSITSSTNIRSIVCWRKFHNIVTRKFIHSTKAMLQFQLEESADVYFTIIWNFVGTAFLDTGYIGLQDPTPAGEVALFVVPGFAAL